MKFNDRFGKGILDEIINFKTNKLMSATNATLERLAKMSTNRPAKKEATAAFFKPKKGKNTIILLNTPFGAGDPFMEWGGHKNLLDVNYYTVPCNSFNKGEECLVCQIVDDLKKANWKGNMPIWKPIEMVKRFYSPVIDLDEVEKGVQLWAYGVSVLSQFENWLKNLEEGETEFYNPEAPEKVIITYNPDAAPAEQYKLDKKTVKAFTEEQNADWSAQIKPLDQILVSTLTEEEVKERLSVYLEKMANLVGATEVAEEESTPVASPKVVDTAKGKLAEMKKGKA